MINIYTLITYTSGESGWIDRCGDFQSGSDSALEIHYFNETKDIGKWWARSQFDGGKEHTVLINGIDPDNACLITEEDIEKYSLIYDEIENFRFDEYQMLKENRDKAIAEEQIRKQKESEAKAQKVKEQTEASERKQLASLLAKYGNN